MSRKSWESDTGLRWRYVLAWMQANGWSPHGASGTDWTKPLPGWMLAKAPPWSVQDAHGRLGWVSLGSNGADEPMSETLVRIAHISEVPLGRMCYEIMKLQLSCE